MKIAIPVTGEQLDPHFGHCENFAVYDVNQQAKTISETNRITPPPHEPGLLPGWLKSQGIDLIITGGMGQKAIQLCHQNQIEVILGAQSTAPQTLIEQFLNEKLSAGSNACDH